MNPGLRVAIYSQDGLGLGHLRRNTLIGEQLLERTPDGNVLLLADSPMAPFFKLSAGMDHLKLPSVRKVDHGRWEANGLRLSEPDLRQLRTNVLRDVILTYQPDLVLVDHMPGGARGEMIPVLEIVKQVHPDCCVILGLRDILDAQDVIARVWQTEGAYDALRCYYDGVLIYGNEDIFKTGTIYSLPVLRHGIQYCGYVVNQGPVRQREELAQINGERRPLVFVCAGGGADGYPLLDAYIQAVRWLGDSVGFQTVMAAGANAADHEYESLRSAARDLPVVVIPYTGDSISYMASADLVVCMAGYNTLSEVLYLKKKALVVPRSGPSAEQRMRAEIFANRGWIDVLQLADLTPETLARRIVADLARSDFPTYDPALNMSGAAQAACHLLNFLE